MINLLKQFFFILIKLNSLKSKKFLFSKDKNFPI